MISLTCLGANIVFITLAFFLRFTGTTMVILALSSVAILMVSIVYYSRPKPKLITLAEPANKKSIIKSHKILTLAGETVEHDSSF
jgi:hypothetical protein